METATATAPAPAPAPAPATDTTSHSPSPTPAPPVPSAPGPRATALQKLYTDAIAHVLKTCSYNHFAACFPTPARHIAPSMRGVHEQFTTKIGASAHDEFALILEDRDVVANLNALDALVDEARKRKARAAETGASESNRIIPHTLRPSQLYLSHLAPSLIRHAQEMKSQQEQIQTENAQLLERVLRQRDQIATTMQSLEAVVEDLDATVAALTKDDELEEVREEVRVVDEQMRSEME